MCGALSCGLGARTEYLARPYLRFAQTRAFADSEEGVERLRAACAD